MTNLFEEKFKNSLNFLKIILQTELFLKNVLLKLKMECRVIIWFSTNRMKKSIITKNCLKHGKR